MKHGFLTGMTVLLVCGALVGRGQAAAGGTVIVMMDEKSLGTISASEVESLALAGFREQGYRVLDRDMVAARLRNEQNLMKMVGDPKAAATLGMQMGADFVAVGEAVAKPAASRIAESNLRTYEAVVTFRVVRSDTAEVMTSVSETASVVALEDIGGNSKALKAAGRAATEKLLAELAKGLADSGGGSVSRTVTLTFGGTDQLWMVKEIRAMLRNQDEWARNVVQKRYAVGTVVFELETSEPSETLAEKVVMARPDGLRFSVVSIDSDKIMLKAVATE
jgi:hypothetical protein